MFVCKVQVRIPDVSKQEEKRRNEAGRGTGENRKRRNGTLGKKERSLRKCVA